MSQIHVYNYYALNKVYSYFKLVYLSLFVVNLCRL